MYELQNEYACDSYPPRFRTASTKLPFKQTSLLCSGVRLSLGVVAAFGAGVTTAAADTPPAKRRPPRIIIFLQLDGVSWWRYGFVD
jgi:hypothetical protein